MRAWVELQLQSWLAQIRKKVPGMKLIAAAMLSLTVSIAASQGARAAVPAGADDPAERLSDRNCAMDEDASFVACAEAAAENRSSADWMVTEIARLRTLPEPSETDLIMLREYERRLSADRSVLVITPNAD